MVTILLLSYCMAVTIYSLFHFVLLIDDFKLIYTFLYILSPNTPNQTTYSRIIYSYDLKDYPYPSPLFHNVFLMLFILKVNIKLLIFWVYNIVSFKANVKHTWENLILSFITKANIILLSSSPVFSIVNPFDD